MGHNEMLIRRALEGVPRDRVVISVKFGALRDPAGMFVGNDSRPAAVKNFLAYSLRRLGTDYIDIYRPARLDPTVPIEDTIGAIADMIRAGYVRHVGLSEIGAETVRRAHAVHPIVDLQIEYSLMSRGIEADDPADDARARHRHHRLRRALARTVERPPAGRPATKAIIRIVRMPRFQQGNVEQNLRLVEALRQIGKEKGASPAQLARGLGALARRRYPAGDGRAPPRATQGVARRARPASSRAADLARIDAAVSPELTAGTRYDAPQMAHLDSEAHA